MAFLKERFESPSRFGSGRTQLPRMDRFQTQLMDFKNTMIGRTDNNIFDNSKVAILHSRQLQSMIKKGITQPSTFQRMIINTKTPTNQQQKNRRIIFSTTIYKERSQSHYEVENDLIKTIDLVPPKPQVLDCLNSTFHQIQKNRGRSLKISGFF